MRLVQSQGKDGAKVLRNAGLWRRCEFMTAIWEIKLWRHDVGDFLNVASLSCPSQTPPHLNEVRRLVVRYILDALPRSGRLIFLHALNI